MRKISRYTVLLSVAGLVILAALATQVPSVKSRLDWRMEIAKAYLRGVLQPAGQMPTAVAQATEVVPTDTPTPTTGPTFTPTATQPGPTATSTPTPTPIPSTVSLPGPEYEKQGANNCGPATMTMYLRFYGWKGTQDDIASVVKPVEDDRNVNVDELNYYVSTHVGWLKSDFRVGGDINELKKFLAAGIPVMIEEGMKLDKAYWPNDDWWAGHYLLLTGYDDASQQFLVLDSFYQNETTAPYKKLDQNWRQFNRVFIFLYLPEQEETVKSLLGENWVSMDASRKHALEVAEAEAKANPQDAYAWFNEGSNLVYFDRYAEAAHAYDSARSAGLPQRMLRYQFGPFFAYFQASRNEDLLAVTEYALKITPNSEEALLWHGWGLYRNGDQTGAVENWRAALKDHPGYGDALYALNFVGVTP